VSVPFPAGFVEFRREELEDSIAGRFRRQAAAHRHRQAVRYGDRSVTYAELAAHADQVGAALLAAGGDRSEPVAVVASQGIPLIAAILGVLRAGKFYVPIDPAWPADRTRAVLAILQARFVVADSANSVAATAPDPTRTIIDCERITPHEVASWPEVSPDAPAYVYFTSGSTGEPKGVIDTHRNVLHNVMRYTNGLGISPEDRMTLLQSSTFSGAVSSMFGALLNGAALFPFDAAGSSPGAMAEWIQREEITICHSVPTLFRSFVAGRHFPSVRVIRLEGDRASHHDVELFRAHFSERCVLVNGLGATETGLVRRLVIGRDTRIAEGIIPIGYPVDDMEIVLLEEEGPAEPGKIGEIAVRSKYLSPGYWNHPDLTARAFLPGTAEDPRRTYRTGDLGRFQPDGCLEYLGRKDFRVKIRGNTVETAEIEQALVRMPEIREAVVVARQLAGGEQGLVAYFTRADGAPTVTVRSLREHLGGSLPAWMIPARFVELDSLPLSDNGKLDRVALPAPRPERPDGAAPFVAPANALQDMIAGIWEELLDVEPVGIHDAFLDLGGDSLLAVRMIERIEQRLGRRISLAVLAGASTIEELSAALLDSETRDLNRPLVPLQTEGELAPFYFLHGDYWSDGLYCLPLQSHLDHDRPVYLIPPAGLDGSVIPGSIEAMADRHLSALLEVQPRGPYLLGGNCNGGLVAFEMARRLVAAGERVDLLVVIRASAGEHNLRLPRRIVRVLGRGLGLNGAREGAAWSEARRLLKRWEQIPQGERNRRILAKARRMAARAVGAGSSNGVTPVVPRVPVNRREAMRDAYMRAAEEYVPLSYSGRVTLFWPEHDPASPESAAEEWSQVAGEVDLQVIPGDHITYSTRHLPEFGAQLRERLRTVQGASR
jgi:amino acid adenylation domain-containing protein